MGLDLWFPDDVTRILTALSSAGAAHGPEYQQALHDVALAFGVSVPDQRGPGRNGDRQMTIAGEWRRPDSR